MFTKIKSYAQATGWVGLLIGLISMLESIDDPATFAEISAIALLTVLYGTIIAYFYATPVSTKLQFRLDELKKAS